MNSHRKVARAPAFRIALLASAVLLAACGQRTAQQTPRQGNALPEPDHRTALPAAAQVKTLPGSSSAGRRDEGSPPASAPAPAAFMVSQDMAVRAAAGEALPGPGYQQATNTERYEEIRENPLQRVAEAPVSTFSLDVDTGSYSNVRRFLANGTLPPKDAVRIEELVNYFPYDYPLPRGEHPFGISTEIAPAPWNPAHWLLRAAVRADEPDAERMPPANLVFLVDVSGSMDTPQKLPLLRSALKLLVDQLREEDRVSLVVYAGRESVVLEPTSGREKERIRGAIDQLSAGGSTAGEAGVRLAYRMARQGYIEKGINRVLLATDGDFNVGIADTEQLKDLVERERESGVQL
ncbi:MAG: vWA domain-containing protein, partial [Gammaproteobacteria bacterium]